jgi:hypothetical protein
MLLAEQLSPKDRWKRLELWVDNLKTANIIETP